MLPEVPLGPRPQASLGVVRPVDARGLIVGPKVSFVQDEGVELAPPPRGVVQLSAVPFCDHKFPAAETGAVNVQHQGGCARGRGPAQSPERPVPPPYLQGTVPGPRYSSAPEQGPCSPSCWPGGSGQAQTALGARRGRHGRARDRSQGAATGQTPPWGFPGWPWAGADGRHLACPSSVQLPACSPGSGHTLLTVDAEAGVRGQRRPGGGPPRPLLLGTVLDKHLEPPAQGVTSPAGAGEHSAQGPPATKTRHWQGLRGASLALQVPAPARRRSPAVGGEGDAVHGALEVEVVEHGSADQADQQRVAPCGKGEPVPHTATMPPRAAGPRKAQPRRMKPGPRGANGTQPGPAQPPRPKPTRAADTEESRERPARTAAPGSRRTAGLQSAGCPLCLSPLTTPRPLLSAKGGYLHRQ